MLKRWKTINHKTIFNNKYWSYELKTFDLGDGIEREYHYVHTLGSTMIIPKFEEKYVLVEQYRYLNDLMSIEFPCGSIENNFDELSNAKKELEEETGFSSEELVKIGFFSPYNGVADELCFVYFTDKLIKIKSQPDETEEFKTFFLSDEEIEDLISSNTIWDGMTIAAWKIFQNWKQRNK